MCSGKSKKQIQTQQSGEHQLKMWKEWHCACVRDGKDVSLVIFRLFTNAVKALSLHAKLFQTPVGPDQDVHWHLSVHLLTFVLRFALSFSLLLLSFSFFPFCTG